MPLITSLHLVDAAASAGGGHSPPAITRSTSSKSRGTLVNVFMPLAVTRTLSSSRMPARQMQITCETRRLTIAARQGDTRMGRCLQTWTCSDNVHQGSTVVLAIAVQQMMKVPMRGTDETRHRHNSAVCSRRTAEVVVALHHLLHQKPRVVGFEGWFEERWIKIYTCTMPQRQ